MNENIRQMDEQPMEAVLVQRLNQAAHRAFGTLKAAETTFVKRAVTQDRREAALL